MDANILCKLLAQRIPPEQFQLYGLEVVFIDPDRNNKPCTAPQESPYDTPENRAIVDDVIKNYNVLEAEYLVQQAKEKAATETKAKLVEIDLKSIRSIREWLAARDDSPEFIKDYELQAIEVRQKMYAY